MPRWEEETADSRGGRPRQLRPSVALVPAPSASSNGSSVVSTGCHCWCTRQRRVVSGLDPPALRLLLWFLTRATSLRRQVSTTAWRCPVSTMNTWPAPWSDKKGARTWSPMAPVAGPMATSPRQYLERSQRAGPAVTEPLGLGSALATTLFERAIFRQSGRRSTVRIDPNCSTSILPPA